MPRHLISLKDSPSVPTEPHLPDWGRATGLPFEICGLSVPRQRAHSLVAQRTILATIRTNCSTFGALLHPCKQRVVTGFLVFWRGKVNSGQPFPNFPPRQSGELQAKSLILLAKKSGRSSKRCLARHGHSKDSAFCASKRRLERSIVVDTNGHQ
jgi:hypothetical protein